MENMDEYIKRSDVLEAIKHAWAKGLEPTQYIEIIEAPDVAPVVHGKWLDEDFPEKMATVHGMAICSVCGKLSHKAEHGYNILSKYCPNCGAKMDLED